MKFKKIIINTLVLSLFFSVRLFSQDSTDIQLMDLLNTPVSVASKYEQKASNAPGSIAIVTSEEISRFGYKTLSEILSSVRSFYLRYDRNYMNIGVRGLDRPSSYTNNILVLVNGHTLNENIYGSPLLGYDLGIDVNQIERIEIVQGPGSILYGTGALLGVVNVITKDGRSIDGVIASGSAGSFDTYQSRLCFGKEFFGSLDISGSLQAGSSRGPDLYFRDYDDSLNNFGRNSGLDWEKFLGFYTVIKYKKARIKILYSEREKGIPTASYGTIFNSPYSKTYDKREYIELKYEFGLGIGTNVMTRLYLDNYKYEGWWPYSFDSASCTDLSILCDDLNIQKDFNKGTWMGAEAQFVWDLSADNRLVAGSEFKHNQVAQYRLWNDEVTIFDKNNPYNIFSAFIQDQYQIFDIFAVNLGLRYDNYSNDGYAITPRLALIYNPLSTSTLKFILASGYRAPNIYEMFYEDGLSDFPNPDLKPETIISSELSWVQQFSKNFNGSFSAFNYRIVDLIEQVIRQDSTRQFQNRDEVQAYGVEVEFKAHSNFGLWSYASMSYCIAEDLNNKVWLNNSPKGIAKLGLSQEVFNSLFLTGEFLYETERKTVYSGVNTEPYLLTNLFISYNDYLCNKPNTPVKMLTFSLKIYNVFDIDYYHPAGNEHVQKAILQDGIKLLFEFTVRI